MECTDNCETTTSFTLKHYKIIDFYCVFIRTMISNIDIEKALKNNTEHNISILKEIRWNIEKFYREAQTALHELLITYEVRNRIIWMGIGFQTTRDKDH